MNFKYLSLPPIPHNLLINTTLDIVRLQENVYEYTSKFYMQYSINDPELHFYLSNEFPECLINCYIAHPGLNIHKDYGRTECMNFILETGGLNAKLNFYNDNKKIISSDPIISNQWMWLNTDVFHNVSGLDTAQFSITITPFSAIRTS